MPLAAAVNVTGVLGHTVLLAGDAVTDGAALTVSSAALVGVDEHEFANTARYCLLLSVATGVNVYVAVVAPAMSPKETPSVELCHFTLVEPVAAALNVTDVPHDVWLPGCVVMTGAAVTVRVAAVVVADPHEFVKTAR